MIREVSVVGVVLLGLLAIPACGSDRGESGLNAPCTRSKDCERDLICEKGVCTSADASVLGADAGVDAADAGD
ncbi:hypothetical protein AKJ09_09749 [Labilithrix luteola]|uniref:Uncharacterized protein n=1 Tax=Labilithrix luteola TaxID=1391654 RepID=A0A0K1QBC2_9BACT|nr:hypothetical protein [Labilithrix luteola]AKV03086.1 hypothetical protein AKJ09_09749 [Labilithrix luteola]